MAFAIASGLIPSASEAQLTVTETVAPSLGTVIAGPAGRQFALNTDGTVTGANAADYLYGSSEGTLIVHKRQGLGLASVVAENITTTGGVIVNSIPCRWHNEPQQNCDGNGLFVTAVGRRRLLVGVDLTTSQTHVGGDTASVSYDITITLF
jgi:hypothetical protein